MAIEIDLTDAQTRAVSWALGPCRRALQSGALDVELDSDELPTLDDNTLTIRSRAETVADDLEYRLTTQIEDMMRTELGTGQKSGFKRAAANAADKIADAV